MSDVLEDGAISHGEHASIPSHARLPLPLVLISRFVRGLHVVCIGSGSVTAASDFSRRMKFDGALYTDPTRAVYRALRVHKGMRRVIRGLPTNASAAIELKY